MAARGPASHNQPTPGAGFTIIEVLIVLAIAGLILLLVFQAIPALQRNSRNSQRKQDTATILQAVSHFELNNSGAFPSACGTLSGQLDCSKLKVYQYDPVSDISFSSISGSVAGPHTNVATVEVHAHYKCSNGSASNTGAGSRDIVALYAVEDGSGTGISQCQEL